MRFFFCIFVGNLRQTQKNGFYTQHPIDVMLQFDANANAHADIDASVNGPKLTTINFQFVKSNYGLDLASGRSKFHIFVANFGKIQGWRPFLN